MGIFNYIDTFFFISLGITFILILLLVFHFKQRIATLENKNDTMFEIINNIVQELSSIKNSQNNLCSPSFYEVNPPVNNYVANLTPSFNNNYVLGEKKDAEPKLLVSDGDDDSSDEDSDSEESEDSTDDEDDSEDEKSVKIINVNMKDTIEVNEIVSDNDDEDMSNMEDLKQDITSFSNVNENIIQVEKIETKNIPETNLEDIKVARSKEVLQEIYRKMTISELKAVVITKGLSSNPSKLKKNDLLKLLENMEE